MVAKKEKETSKEVKENKVSVIDFKLKNKLTNLEYIGLKSQLKITNDFNIDYTETELFNSLKTFNERPVFIE